MSQPVSLQRLFAGGDGGLGHLMERARTLAELNQTVRHHLPPSLVAHVSVANLRDGTLILQTSASEWRTRIHFLAPQILEALHSHPRLPKVTAIQIRIAPPVRQHPPPSRGTKISSQTAELLRAAARSIGDDALRQALARLASRYRD